MKRSLVLIISTYLLFIPFSMALGQTASVVQLPHYDNLNPFDGNQLNYTPQYPAPGDTVDFTLENYINDLDKAQISWKVNGKTVNSGVGVKSISAVAGKIGTTLTVTAEILTADGNDTVKTVTLSPASVDLLWLGRGYTPPFYKGRSVLAYQGTALVVAIPNDNGLSHGYTYNWKSYGDAIPNTSGFGKNIIALQGDILLKPFNITADVSSLDGTFNGSKNIEINFQEPVTLLYEDDPLYGVLYNHALTTNTIPNSQKEISVRAEPYFYTNSGLFNANVNYTWMVNGSSLGSNVTSQELTFKIPDGNGNSQISIKTTSKDKLLQYNTSQAQINF